MEEPISSDEYFMNIETETNIRCLKAGTDETLSRKENKVCQFYKKTKLFTFYSFFSVFVSQIILDPSAVFRALYKTRPWMEKCSSGRPTR